MTVFRVRFFGIALLVTLAGTAQAHADPILWNYNWSSSPGVVYSDNSATSYITLTNSQIQAAAGNSDVVATNLRTYSDATAAAPATFTAKAYTLSLTIQDVTSGHSGTVTFTGQFNGTLTALSALIQNTFTGPTTQTLVLGNDQYVVTIGPYAPPGPASGTSTGAISAFAQVSVKPVTIQDVPEPSTLILMGCAAPLAGLALWRRRFVR